MLQIRVEGVVRSKEIKAGYQGSERKLNVKVTFDGGTVKTKLDAASYDTFPAEGQPVVLYLTGDIIQGEFGSRIEQIKCLKFEAPNGAARRAA